MNNNFTGSELYKSACHITTSYMTLINTKFRSNKFKTLIFAESQSYVLIDNLTLTNNHMTGKTYDISRKSKLKMYNAKISRNKFKSNFLSMESNYRALIQNNTLTENNFGRTSYVLNENCRIQLSNVKFNRNTLRNALLQIKSNSRKPEVF